MMNVVVEKEIEQIETVGALRQALKDVPDDMPIEDAMGEPLLASWLRNKKTGKKAIEIR